MVGKKVEAGTRLSKVLFKLWPDEVLFTISCKDSDRGVTMRAKGKDLEAPAGKVLVVDGKLETKATFPREGLLEAYRAKLIKALEQYEEENGELARVK